MPASEPRARRSALASSLESGKVDALLIASGPNLRYLTGFTGSNGMLLLSPEGAWFFTDPRYAIQSEAEVDCTVKISKGPLLYDVAAVARRRRIRRLGFERGRTTYESYENLDKELPGAALVPVSGWVERLRRVKSPAEVALMRQSARTCSRAFEQAARHAREGMRESDLAAEIEYRMRRLGAEKPAFETIVASGRRSALPHASPTGAVLRRGDLVVVDMGAFEQGYASDMTRMLSVGKPSPQVKRLFEAVLEAQLAALDAVRAGIEASHVDRAARRVLRAHGLERAFVHSTGHGVGLEIHEAPRLGKKEKLRLEAGMAVTVEPGAYLEDLGGVRIEDTVIVTESGCEVLTPVAKDLRVI